MTQCTSASLVLVWSNGGYHYSWIESRRSICLYWIHFGFGSNYTNQFKSLTFIDSDRTEQYAGWGSKALKIKIFMFKQPVTWFLDRLRAWREVKGRTVEEGKGNNCGDDNLQIFGGSTGLISEAGSQRRIMTFLKQDLVLRDPETQTYCGCKVESQGLQGRMISHWFEVFITFIALQQ